MRSMFALVALAVAVVLAVTVAVVPSVTAQEAQEAIEVRPQDPRSTDVFEIAVRHSTTCPVTRVESRWVDRLLVITWVEGGPCLASLPSLQTESVFIGPVTPGEYTVQLFLLHEEPGVTGLPSLLATETFVARIEGDPGRLSLDPLRPTPRDPFRLTVRSPCPAQTTVEPPEISGQVITVVERINNSILAPCHDRNVDLVKFELGTLAPGDYTVRLFSVETDVLGKGEVPDEPSVEVQLTVAESPKLELANGRFTVEARWKEPGGDAGFGEPMALTSDTGYFWFFNEENVEVLIKVLDACSFADRFWVFAAGLTNVEVELTVVDTLAQVEQTYTNPLGQPFQPTQDTATFATCSVLP